MYGSNVCDACNIAYPRGTHDCPVCENVTRFIMGRKPDSDWQSKAHEALVAPVLVGGPCKVDVRPVKDERGRQWLYVEHVRRAGYNAALDTFDLLETPEGIVELQGYDAPRARWWIEVM